jgi:DeoR/GlpR family transcriptional regulator of sugar metabolism
MSRRERQRQILTVLETTPELTLIDACRSLGASSATIRRDFVRLTEEGQVERTWGGVRLASRGTLQMGPPAFAERAGLNAASKRLVAESASELLRDGDVVMVDGGTTTFQLAEFIAHKRIRIITNSLVFAHAIDRLKSGRLGAEVYLTGGLLEPQSGVVVGSMAEDCLRRYEARWFFMSAAGVDAQSVTNYGEAVLGSERVMVERAERLALLVDESKLGRRAMCELCKTSELDIIYTVDSPQHAALVAEISSSGTEVVMAGEARVV